MRKSSKVQISAVLKEGKALLRLTDAIQSGGDAGAASIRAQVDSFVKAGVREAHVYLNSRGGDVFEAVEIVNELSRFDIVTVEVGALAASAATYITSSFHTTARANSQFMFHRPNLGTYGNIDSIEADLKLLRQTTDDYYARYSQKTGLPLPEIESMLSGGDVWLTASQALEKGFIDAITNSGEAAQPAALSGREKWTLEDYLEKDPAAYVRLRQEAPEAALRLEAGYFGQAPAAAQRPIKPLSERISSGGRDNWTLEDYLEKDPEAYRRMRTDNPLLAQRLEKNYFTQR